MQKAPTKECYIYNYMVRITMLHVVFDVFLNCADGTKSHKVSHISFASLQKQQK